LGLRGGKKGKTVGERLVVILSPLEGKGQRERRNSPDWVGKKAGSKIGRMTERRLWGCHPDR